MAKSALIKSSIVKKYWMAGTGLFLCVFLVGHLAGNLQLLMNPLEAKESFNAYAKFMTSNPAVKILSYITYFSIIFHAIDGILLVMQNKKARPEKYAYNKPGNSSLWTSRYMGILGTIILIFIVVHMSGFWAAMHFNLEPTYRLEDGTLVKNLYDEVITAFHVPWYVLFYVLCMAALAFHLSHGFQSAFQSMGLRHQKYTTLINKTGIGFSILISVLFAIIPIFIYLDIYPI
ncbi:MAG: succinate dehydrogenase cytochrome b subunit [Flavobacteriales bacterium]|nr:succinate dehydrogenase cytochrome b subunit [Flavobacteriales bacterium]